MLAGGHSRRLREDKRLVKLHFADEHLSLLEWSTRRLKAVCSELVVATGMPISAHNDDLRAIVGSNRCVSDKPSGRPSGPGAGIVAAGEALPNTSFLTLACDLPFVSVRLLCEVLNTWRSSHADLAAVHWNGHWEPLVAVYGPRSIQKISHRIASGRRSLHQVALDRQLRVAACTPDGIDLDLELTNLNTAQDLKKARAAARSTETSRFML